MFSFVGNLKLFIMEAKELRIGNYVDFGEPCRVFEIQKNCFYVENSEGIDFKNTICELKPIPLTEEILLKCGFEKHNKEFWFKDFFIGLIDNSFNLKEGIGVYVADVYYLHQLQNLYFALTNEELTVNL